MQVAYPNQRVQALPELTGGSFSPPEPDDRILGVSEGNGIGPLAFYAERYRLAHMAIVAGFRTHHDVGGFERAVRAGVPVLICTEDGSLGRPGPATAGLKDLLQRQHISRVLVCGHAAMTQAVATIAAECGIPCQLCDAHPSETASWS